jgi:hypothetical protein
LKSTWTASGKYRHVKNTSSHTQHSNKMEDLLSDFQLKGNPINLGHLASLQNADYMQFNADRNKIQNTMFITSWRNMKNWLIGNQ